jgi:hypothetical protein
MLSACAETGTAPQAPPAPASVQVISRNPQPGAAGQRLPDSVVVRVVDEQGRGVPGATVQFSVSSGGGRMLPLVKYTDHVGYARAAWVLGAATGEQSAMASSPGLAPADLRARAVVVPPQTASMLGVLGDYIAATRAGLLAAAPLNPQSAAYFDAKVAMLGSPTLAGDIIEGGRFTDGRAAARSGRSIPIVAVLPLEGMRAEATQLVRYAESALPALEAFLALPYPADTVRVWYGFGLGSSGGGGALHMEDRGTYEARTGPQRLPHDAIVVHELAHTYVSNESFAQFLELYVYNTLRGASAEVATWTHTRGYVPGLGTNEGVHALLDIYQLVGPEVMAAACRALFPLRPVYGQPLTPAAQQAFVNAVPADVRPQVAVKIAMVRT